MENEKRSLISRAVDTIFGVSGAIVGIIGILAMVGIEKIFGINQKPK